MAQGKGSEAQRVLKGAAARHPNLVVALVQCHLVLGQVKEAGEVVREAKQQLSDPKSQLSAAEVTGARRTIATSLADTGHEPLFREAVGLIDQSLAAGSGDATDVYAKVRILGSRPSHRQEALALLLQLGRRQDLSAEQVVYLARLYLGTGNSSEAVSVINNYVRAEKTTRDDRLACVRSAAQVFERFAQESPEAGKALDPVAEKMYRTAAEGSGQPTDLLALAGYLGRRHRTQEALALCFEQAGERCPPEEVGSTATAVVCAAPASGEQLARVERYVSDCVEKSPGSPVLRKLLAIVQARHGRYAEAAASYRAILKQSARDVDALNNLALMLALQKGRPAESLALLEKAAWLDGPTAGLLDTRGMVHLHAGELEPAVRDFREAVAQAPTPLRHLHLAQACLRAGKREEALRAFTKARDAGVERWLVLPAEQEAYALLGPELANR
jgi:tetratricopeptide (TPR) repeat protein